MADFSLWCDFVERGFLGGEFVNLIDSGAIFGATSNPSIFAAALKSAAYADEKAKISHKRPKERYEALAFSDVRAAARALLPLWQRDKNNGWMSIEIDPFLCDDAAGSIDEAKRIWAAIDMPNVMIKIPATNAAPEAISAIYKSGISVNVTLVFTPRQVKMALEALEAAGANLAGNLGGNPMENRGANLSANLGGNPAGNRRPAQRAVISIFVSRFDRFLEAKNRTKDPTPRLGIANATNCYRLIEAAGSGEIRALFASTGVKDSFIAPTYYVKNLAFENAINTAPLETLRAYLKEQCEIIAPRNDAESVARDFDVEAIGEGLLDEGLEAFKKSFEEILRVV